jgi:hypothetical protein
MLRSTVVKTFAIAVLASMLFLLTSRPLFAQKPSRISGTVVDQQLRPLGDVEVTLTTRTGTIKTRTASDGSFEFPSVARGRAIIVANRAGFAAAEAYEANVRPGKDYVFEVRLYPRAGAAYTAFDPAFQQPPVFNDPRGVNFGLSASYASVTTQIADKKVSGSGSTFRAEVAHEFDTNWIGFLRLSTSHVSSDNDLVFNYNTSNNLTFRNYNLKNAEIGVQFAFRKNSKKVRPYGSAWAGLSRFTSDVGVTTLEKPANATSNGIVVGLGAGLEYSVTYRWSVDLGVEVAGTGYNGWKFNNSNVGFPNVSEYPRQLQVTVRYWPWAY